MGSSQEGKGSFPPAPGAVLGSRTHPETRGQEGQGPRP